MPDAAGGPAAETGRVRLALLSLLFALTLAAPAAADSIAYIKDANVWVAQPDGSDARALTTDGGYSSPSQADDGTVLVVRGSKFVKLDRKGNQLATFASLLTSAGWWSASRADPERVHVIPHGALDYLTRQEHEDPLPDELGRVEGPVVLSFGVLRPCKKGIDVLVDAFRDLEGAELWVVGRPWMAVEPFKAAAAQARGRVRFVDRFVSDSELPAFFRRADLVVLPHRRVDQSGVLYTALAFGKAMVLSDVGGFSEIGRDHGAAELVPAGDRDALAEAIGRLLADPAERAALEGRARAARRGPLRGTASPSETMALYRGAPVRAILLGKHKRSAVGALDHLVASGVEVAAVVAPPDTGRCRGPAAPGPGGRAPRGAAGPGRGAVRGDRGGRVGRCGPGALLSLLETHPIAPDRRRVAWRV